MSALPFTRESNAIHFPSGDQFGRPVSAPLIHVSRFGEFWNSSVTQISFVPVRVERYATCTPSGENAGLLSNWLEVATGSGAPEPSERILQRLISLRCCTYASVSERADHAGVKALVPAAAMRSMGLPSSGRRQRLRAVAPRAIDSTRLRPSNAHANPSTFLFSDVSARGACDFFQSSRNTSAVS